MKGFRLFPSFLIAFALTLLSIGQAQAQVTYYINDHLGSPIAAEDENGVLLWRERYSPYGDTQLGQKRDEETPGYTGKRYYADLGLSYFGARWYDSTSGRFITPDPAGWQASSPYFSFNQYAYANNNPYVYTDPDGEFPFLIPVAIFLAKEIAGEIFEQATGLPALFTVKGAGKAIFKRSRKLVTSGPIRHTPLNPGPLAPDIAKTFRSATYTQHRLKKDTVLYRVISENGNPTGSYWTSTKPKGPLQSVIDSALDQNWGNAATKVVKAKIPKGTEVFEGVAAQQRGLVGGGNQIFIPKVKKDWIK